MLVGMRSRLIHNRTQLSNSIRGFAMEFGVTIAAGMSKIEPLLERIAADDTMPELAREIFALHAREFIQLRSEIEKLDDRLMAWHRQNECSRRLAQIPGVGPVGATLLMLKTPDPALFKSGRDFCCLDRAHASKPFDSGQEQAWWDYTRRRPAVAKHAGRWGNRDRQARTKALRQESNALAAAIDRSEKAKSRSCGARE